MNKYNVLLVYNELSYNSVIIAKDLYQLDNHNYDVFCISNDNQKEFIEKIYEKKYDLILFTGESSVFHKFQANKVSKYICLKDPNSPVEDKFEGAIYAVIGKYISNNDLDIYIRSNINVNVSSNDSHDIVFDNITYYTFAHNIEELINFFCVMSDASYKTIKVKQFNLSYSFNKINAKTFNDTFSIKNYLSSLEEKYKNMIDDSSNVFIFLEQLPHKFSTLDLCYIRSYDDIIDKNSIFYYND